LADHLARHRALVAAIDALDGSEPIAEFDRLAVDEYGAADPASNVDLGESIADDEWPAWSRSMRELRAAVAGACRRRQLHAAIAHAARVTADAAALSAQIARML